MSLPTLLQALEMDGVSCSLSVVSGDNLGYLHILNGKLVDARSQDVVGTEAAYDIFGWEDTRIEIEGYRNNRPRRIDQPLTAILLDASRLGDERNVAAKAELAELANLAEAALEEAESTDESEPASTEVKVNGDSSGSIWGIQHHVPEEGPMNLQQVIEDFQEDIPEFVSTDLVNIESGLSIGGTSVDNDFDGSVAAASYAEVVKSNRRALDLLGLGADSAEDILITTERVYVLIRMLGSEYYHVVAVGKKGNLGLARAIMKKYGSKLHGAVKDLS